MKKITLFLFFVLSFGLTNAQKLTEKAQVSILSCGSGEELYAKFGHTAIRIYDPGQEPSIDVAFNYGTFDFETEGFYFKFVKGITDYKVDWEFGVNLFMRYNEKEIPVWEQVLNLTLQEKQTLLDALMVNMAPENRFYRYNYVYDNCATRPRDMIELALGDTIRFPQRKIGDTFRQLIAGCVGTDTWNKFGIDIVLGSSADKVANARERMFLPLEMMYYFDDAKRPDGKPLVLSNTQVVSEKKDKDTGYNLLKPAPVLLFFLFLIAGISYLGRAKNMLWLDAMLFSLFGLMGVVVFFLNFYSVHPLVAGNYNLLWVHPLHLVFVLLLPFKRLRKILTYYQILQVFAILVALAGYLFLPQEFNVAFIPLMLLLLMRGLFFIWKQRAAIEK